MMRSLLLIAIFGISAIVASEEGCVQSDLFYEQLDCTPIFKNKDDKCPSAYDCSAYERRPRDQCYLRGKTYQMGEKVLEEELFRNCLPECECNSNANIECIVSECPEDIDPSDLPHGCKFKYNVNYCCNVGFVCPEKEKVVYCKEGNATHLEGTRYKSESGEHTCVCTKDRFGRPESVCRRNVCFNQIAFKDELDQYCAPVYINKYYPCPRAMYCPKNKEALIPWKEEDKNTKCRLGNEFWSIGQSAVVDLVRFNVVKKIKCECNLPPYVTCYNN